MKDYKEHKYTEETGDKFVEVLGNKLRSFSEEPPQGMFERIEQTLREVEMTAERSAEVAEPKRVVPLWNRPFVRGVAAAMAVAMLALVVVVTLRNNAPEEIRVVAQQHAEQPMSEQPSLVETPELQKVAVATPKVESTAPTTHTAIITSTAANVEESVENTREVEQVATEVEGGVDVEAQTTTQTTTQTVEAQQSTERENNKKSVRTTSSRQNQQELEEYWRVALSEKSSPKSILSSAKVGLYAQNVGINYGHIVLNNLTNSSMIVKEQNDISAGNSYMPPFHAQQNPDSKLEHFMPITAGVTVSFSLNDWLSVDSGLLYTNIYSKGDNEGSMSVYARRRTIDYLGVPIAASLYFANFDRLSLYGRVGGTVELCINAKDKTYMDGNLVEKHTLEVPLLTFALDAAVGATYQIVRNMGIFGEVGCSYWISPAYYPDNYRTVHPLSLSTRFGLRFNFN